MMDTVDVRDDLLSFQQSMVLLEPSRMLVPQKMGPSRLAKMLAPVRSEIWLKAGRLRTGRLFTGDILYMSGANLLSKPSCL